MSRCLVVTSWRWTAGRLWEAKTGLPVASEPWGSPPCPGVPRGGRGRSLIAGKDAGASRPSFRLGPHTSGTVSGPASLEDLRALPRGLRLLPPVPRVRTSGASGSWLPPPFILSTHSTPSVLSPKDKGTAALVVTGPRLTTRPRLPGSPSVFVCRLSPFRPPSSAAVPLSVQTVLRSFPVLPEKPSQFCFHVQASTCRGFVPKYHGGLGAVWFSFVARGPMATGPSSSCWPGGPPLPSESFHRHRGLVWGLPLSLGAVSRSPRGPCRVRTALPLVPCPCFSPVCLSQTEYTPLGGPESQTSRPPWDQQPEHSEDPRRSRVLHGAWTRAPSSVSGSQGNRNTEQVRVGSALQSG